MSIAVDAMGGDHAPKEIVAGALQAAALISQKIYLVGVPELIQPHLPSVLPSNVEIIPASQFVEMDEKPLDAYRKKKDSSLIVGAKLVKDGRAQALVSAGNTGAASSTALLTWRQLPGIHRPAIASQLPNRHDGFVMLDSGASPDVDPEHIVEFAIMGRAYAEMVMGRKNPKVQLINIGEEPGKGNAFVKQAFKMLEPYPWFAGNIEGKDMFTTQCDVVVCEAFVGNVVLKTAEGVAEMFAKTIREGVPTNKIIRSLYWPVRQVMAPIREKMDYASVGGSPLLGLNGICIIAHGRSNAKAMKNAILMAQRAVDNQLVDAIRQSVARDLPGSDKPDNNLDSENKQ